MIFFQSTGDNDAALASSSVTSGERVPFPLAARTNTTAAATPLPLSGGSTTSDSGDEDSFSSSYACHLPIYPRYLNQWNRVRMENEAQRRQENGKLDGQPTTQMEAIYRFQSQQFMGGRKDIPQYDDPMRAIEHIACQIFGDTYCDQNDLRTLSHGAFSKNIYALLIGGSFRAIIKEIGSADPCSVALAAGCLNGNLGDGDFAHEKVVASAPAEVFKLKKLDTYLEGVLPQGQVHFADTGFTLRFPKLFGTFRCQDQFYTMSEFASGERLIETIISKAKKGAPLDQVRQNFSRTLATMLVSLGLVHGDGHGGNYMHDESTQTIWPIDLQTAFYSLGASPQNLVKRFVADITWFSNHLNVNGIMNYAPFDPLVLFINALTSDVLRDVRRLDDQDKYYSLLRDAMGMPVAAAAAAAAAAESV